MKLSGDGMNIGKRLHVVSFVFTLLDEVETTGSFERVTFWLYSKNRKSIKSWNLL